MSEQNDDFADRWRKSIEASKRRIRNADFLVERGGPDIRDEVCRVLDLVGKAPADDVAQVCIGTAEARNAAAERLASDEELARRSGAADRQHLLAAVLFAAAEASEAQRIRLGFDWAKHARTNQVVPLVPNQDLDAGEKDDWDAPHRRWFVQRVRAWVRHREDEQRHDMPTIRNPYPAENSSGLANGLREKATVLTKREREVLALRDRGLTFPEIAHELGISHGAAREYAHTGRIKIEK